MALIGSLGVNTFFVLSGFLITWLLLREWDLNHTLSLSDFYYRRALRIFPAYYFFVLITIVADLFFGNNQIQPAILPALTYTTNYFNVFNNHPPLSTAHTWSLAIEEQFYLVWPVRDGPVYLNNFFHSLSGSVAPVMPPSVKVAS